MPGPAPGPEYDAATLAFYDAEAETYASRARGDRSPRLLAFAAMLGAGAHVLELGCGGGQDAAALIELGLDVTPTDGSPGLARVASRRLGKAVRVLRFHEIEDVAAFDGVWANACLLHAPAATLPDILGRIHRALRPGGLFAASFKAGHGGDRDALGRYYNFPTREALADAYAAAAPWASVTIEEGPGGGYDGVERVWLHCTARATPAPALRAP